MVYTNEHSMGVALCVIIMMGMIRRRRARNRRRQVRRKCWVRQWIQRRPRLGAFHALVQELADEDQQSYKHFLRMDQQTFEELERLIAPLIRRQDTVMREAIKPSERLDLTLRFLATGETYQSLEYLYRIPKSTISAIIPETCDAIYRVLKDQFLKVPNSEEAWNDISKEFKERWNFPNCIGAMDGKHVMIKCPVQGGSTYFNYKHFNSVVLMAVVDPDYKFIYVDVGCNGRVSDGGIFNRSEIKKLIEKNKLSIPTAKPLPNRMESVPYVIVGDDAFPLKPYILKPYPSRQLDISRRVFNYRLSRARRIVENVFGILTHRFGIFQKPIALEPEKVVTIVLAACALHNFLRTKCKTTYTPSGSFDSEDNDSNDMVNGDKLQ